MRALVFIAALAFAIASPAETLREFLKSGGVPEDKFTKTELDENVNGSASKKDQIVVAAYVRLKGEMITGNPHVVRYERNSGALVRAEVKPEDEDSCCGSPGDITFAGEFTLISFHINPSAAAMLVLGKDLKLVTTLYGFDVHEVAPGHVVFIENMIHFSPVHPERLELADLPQGIRSEVYPPKGDALRAAFAREHAQPMPPQSTCEKMNDPCTPELYDEDITFVDSDGRGTFAFTVLRSASHATAEDQEPDTVASETALYRYAWNGKSWLYCEEKLPGDRVQSPDHSNESTIRDRCTPSLPVTADMSNAEFSPFDSHRTQ